MTTHLDTFITANQAEIEAALRAHLPLSSLTAARPLNEALTYALFPGGKRLRPVLSLLASDLVGVPRAQGLTIACGVEFLHGSSLIIDDLPGMDDADLRRNRPALHLVFGEGIAMLAALALLNQSYALFAQAAQDCGRSGAVESLVCEAARVVGVEGMIGGQAVDLASRADCADLKTLAGRDLKTVALMRLMMLAGALASGASEEKMLALREFGDCFGQAYQACDDLLDEMCESFSTGKNPGQDARHKRATALTVLGAEGLRRRTAELIERGTQALAQRFGPRLEAQLLAEAAYQVINGCSGDDPSGDSTLAAATAVATARAGDGM